MLTRYKLKRGAGTHYHIDPFTQKEVEIEKEATFLSRDPKLHERFVEKFDIVETNVTEPAPVKESTASTAPAKTTTNTGTDVAGAKTAPPAKADAVPPVIDEDESTLGDDVTAEFPKIKAGGFTVFKQAKDYFVSEDGGKTAINKEALKKVAVDDFVADYLKKP